MKKLKNKIKNIIETILYKYFSRKYVRKLTNKKLRETYSQCVLIINGKLRSLEPRWKIELSRDILVKEIKRRNLSI